MIVQRYAGNVQSMIEAAGGVLWRRTTSHQVEVLLIHRPHRRDWSLPKGKRQKDESALACALREVQEETGLACVVGAKLPTTYYTDRKGRSKRVLYWSMQEVAGEFRPNEEVDAVCWLPADRAGELLTYRHDLVVVSGLRIHRVAAVA